MAAFAPRASGLTLPWPRVPRHVFTRHKRPAHAASRDEVPTVGQRPRRLRSSRSAKRLAGGRATQEHRGHKTAGLDGVQALPVTPRLR
jgi:RNA-directed DNA polymerase